MSSSSWEQVCEYHGRTARNVSHVAFLASAISAFHLNLPRALVILLPWSKQKKIQGGGVIWTKGKVDIMGGEFVGNEASSDGGVIISADGSTTLLAGGVFGGNTAIDGGVVHVGERSELWVEGGTFTKNNAHNSGGVFAVTEGGFIQVGKDLPTMYPVVAACELFHMCVAMYG